MLLVLFSALLFKLCFLFSRSLVFMLTIAFLPSSQRWLERVANSRNKIARESFAIRCLSNQSFSMGVPSLFCSTRGLSCNCLFKDNNRGRLSEEPRTAITSLEASITTAVLCNGGVEDEGEGEEQRKSETDWVVIKGLFFLPTEEHLHSSHLLRRDCAAVCVCAHTHATRFMSERLACAACAFPQWCLFNVMQGWQPAQAAALSDRGR